WGEPGARSRDRLGPFPQLVSDRRNLALFQSDEAQRSPKGRMLKLELWTFALALDCRRRSQRDEFKSVAGCQLGASKRLGASFVMPRSHVTVSPCWSRPHSNGPT